MKLATKKLFHNVLAIAVSICMVCTMTPSLAWAAGGSGSVGNEVGTMDAWESEGGTTASGSTDIKAQVYDPNFKFNSITPGTNYPSKNDFVTAATGKDPLKATFPEGSLPDNYTVEWYIQEVQANPNFDASQPEGPDNPKTILVGSATQIASDSYSKAQTPTEDQIPTFTYPGSAGVVVSPSDLPMQDGKRYEFSVILKDADGNEANATTQISLLPDYPEQILLGTPTGNEDFSVSGNIFQDFTIPPAVSVLEVTPLPDTDETAQKIKDAAANNKNGAETVEGVNQLEIVNNAKPEGKDPYEGPLNVRIPLPDSLKDPMPNEGDKFNVYIADEDGNVTVKEGEVTWAVDEDGNPRTDGEGNKIPVLIVEVEDTGVIVGSFGVGIPVAGTYFMTTQIDSSSPSQAADTIGATMSPAGANMKKPLGTASTFSTYAIAPSYRFTGFTMTVDGATKPIEAADLGYNSVTINPSAYGIKEDSHVVLTAKYASYNIGSDTRTVSANLSCESGASGNYTVSTVYAQGKKNASGTELKPQGTTLTDRTVTTSSALSSTRVDRNVGLLLTFRPSAGTYVKSVTINNKEASFQGSSLMLGSVNENLNIRVTYARGQQPQVEQQDVTVQVQKRPNGRFPATLDGDGGSVVTEATYPVSAGGVLTINAKPYKDMYGLTEVLVYAPADATESKNIVQHVYVSPNGSDNPPTYPNDQITLYNITSDMRVELVYKIMPAYIDVESTEGGWWEWIPGGSSKVEGATTRANKALRAAAGARDNQTGGSLILNNEGDYARLVIYEEDGYELGNVMINGNRVNNLLTKRHGSNGRDYYTLTVYLGEAGSAPSGLGDDPDFPGQPDNIFYTSSNNTKVSMTFNPKVIPAPHFNTITTSVTSFGGGTITPTRNVEDGGTAVINFFPDEGYKVENVWLDDYLLEKDDEALSDYGLTLTLQNVTADHKVQVSFTPGEQEGGDKARHTITATAGVGGTITPSGQFLVYDGITQQFVLAPGTGYQISQVKVDDKVLDPNDANITLRSNTLEVKNITKDMGISVTFKKVGSITAATYVVNTQKTGEGSISPSGPVVVGVGGDVSYSIIPKAGWYVQDVRALYNETGSDAGISLLSLYNKQTFSFKLSDVQENTTVWAVFGQGDENGKIPGTVDPNVPGSGEDVPTPPSDNDIIKIPPDNLVINPEETPGAIVSPSPGEMDIVKEPGTDHAATDVTFTVTVADGYELDTPVVGTGIVVKDGDANVSDQASYKQVGEGVWLVTVPKELVTEDLKIEVNTHPKQGSTEQADLKKVSLSVAGDGYITPGMLKVGDTTGTVQVENGKNQTFNFFAADGWKLHTVYLNGKPTTVTGNVLTLPSIQQDSTIEAVFSKLGEGEPQPPKPKTWNVTILQGNNGEVSPSGTVAVIDGSSLTISSQPKAGYHAVAKVDGVEVPVLGNSIELAKVSKNTTVNIDFVQTVQTQYRTLAVNSTGPGTTSPAGTSLVIDGMKQTVTLIPDAGKKVKSVNVNGTSMIRSVDGTTMSLDLGAINQNTTVDVEFCDAGELRPTDPGYNLPPTGTEVQYWNVTTSAPNGGGVVLPAGATVANGGGVELTLLANSGYEFESVTVNGVDRTSRVQNGTLSLTNVTSNTAVAAKFKKKQSVDLEDYYTVFVSANGNGSVSPAGAMTVAAGGSQTITIMPDPGYKVHDIAVNGVSSGRGFAGSAYTLFNVTEDKNVVVSFEKLGAGESGTSVLTHDIVATSTVNGRVSPEGTIKVADGKNASFTFVPNDGYKLSYVQIDGNDIPAQYIVNNQYIFTEVKEAHSLHAVFTNEGTSVDEFVTVSVGRTLNGTITPSDSVLVKKNESKEFTITPFYGYRVEDILVDGTSIGKADILAGAPIANGRVEYSNGLLKLLSVNRDMSVTATFSKKLIGGDSESPDYVPVTGDTNSNPPNSGAGGSTSIGDGGYIEKPGSDASDAERNPQITITPDPGSMIDKVEVTYGDGSKTVVEDDGTYEYDENGYLVDADGDPIDATTGGKAEIGADGKPVNPVVYPSLGNPHRPTHPSPTTQDIYEQGYIELDGDKIAETGGVDLDVTFRPLDPSQSPDKEIINGQKPEEEQDPNIGVIEGATYYEINATYSGGGRMFPEGRVKAALGQSIFFQMLPSSGYELSALTVDGRDAMGDVTSSRKYVFNNVDGNKSINAVFGFVNNDVVRYNVTASSNVDGGVSPASASVPRGSDAVVYFFPPEGQKVANVTVTKDGNEILNTNEYYSPMYTATNVDGNIDVRVTYEAAGPDDPTWTVDSVRVTANCPAGNGKVSPGEATVPVGSPQTFFFEPDPGYVVDYVLFNDVSTTLKNNPSSFTVTPSEGAENNLAVYFKEATSKDKQFTTVRPVVNGGHAAVSPASANVEVGTSTSFYVYPENGYTIESVKVDGWDVSFKPALPEGVPSQTGAEYTAYLVTIDNVQPGAKVEVNIKTTNKKPIEIKRHNLTITGENAMYSPLGVVQLPEGGKQTITIDPLPGYYLDSVMVTEKDGNGNVVGEPVDMTDDVQNNKFTVEMGTYDKEVYIRYLLVGGDEKPTPAYVTIGSTKMEDGRDVNAIISLRRESDGTLIPLTVDPVTRKLVGSDGKPLEFVRGGTYTFYATAPALDEGKQLILSGASYNGKPQTVPNLTGMVANVKLTANGTLDLVFRELKEGEKPIVNQEFDVRFEIVGGQGSINPETALDGITVQMGDSTGPVMMRPDGDNWMIESVVEVYFDKDGNQLGDPVTVDPRRYKDETYNCTPVANTVVQVTFVECAIVDVKWDKTLGFVAPNPTKNYLKLPVDRVGEPYAFVVAPFEDCYVESFDVTPQGGQTESYFSELQQTQSAVDYLADGGYNVVDFTEGGGVTSPSDEEAAGEGKADVASYAVQARAARVSDFDPIDYNGFIPEKGTTMQNAYAVQTNLDPTKTTVEIGLYTTRQTAQEYTITPSVKGTGGRISPSIPVTVRGGLDQTFNLIADKGNEVKTVLVDGSPITAAQLGTSGTTYTFFAVDRDHTIEVEFGPITSDESERLLRVGSSLARTGDLTGPAIGCLLLVAALGLMVTAISYIRRRNRRRRRYQQ